LFLDGSVLAMTSVTMCRTRMFGLIAVLAIIVCGSQGEVLFLETFDKGELAWTHASDEKYQGKFTLEQGVVEGDRDMMIPNEAKHYGIAQKVEVDPADHDELVVQYDVKYEHGLTCSGSYLKLIKSPFSDLDKIEDGLPYSIMFGPDRCGQNNRVHFIFQYPNKVTGELQEHHMLDPPQIAGMDRKTHLYTLVIKREEFKMKIDNEVVRSGKISDPSEFSPPLTPPEEVDDPEDVKPKDWEDQSEVPDPEDRKPDDWDENEPRMVADPEANMPEGWLVDEPPTIPDVNAVKPEDWDDEEEGAWMPPLIQNPKCDVGCGPWRAPLVANPKYKGEWIPRVINNPKYVGEWKPRKVPNPEHYKVENPRLLKFSAVGIELWVMDANIRFDNVLICTDEGEAGEIALKTWKLKTLGETEEERQQSTSTDTKLENIARMIDDYMSRVHRNVAYLLINSGYGNVVSAVESTGMPNAFTFILLLLCLSPLFASAAYQLYMSYKEGPEEDDAAVAENTTGDTADPDAAEGKKDDAETKDDPVPSDPVGEESEIVPDKEDSGIRQRRVAS